MNEKHLISVCVPVFNSAEYLDKCLGSLIRQTYDNIEIILVIDGEMRDDSVEVCESWASIDKRIKVIRQKHGGLPAARNTGIDNASGEYIGFVDPDDYVEKDMYEKLLIGMQSDESIDVCIEGFIEQDEGAYEGVTKECFDRILNSREAVGMMINQKISDFTWNKLYRKELFKDLRYIEGNNFYDVGTTYKLLEKSRKVRLISYAGYYYIRRKNSLTYGRRIPDFLDSLEMYISRYDDLKDRRKDLRRGLCKGVYGSCVSLAVACLVSGKENRIRNSSRKCKMIKRIQEIKNQNRKLYTNLEKTVVDLSASNRAPVLVLCLGLEQFRRWIRGK